MKLLFLVVVFNKPVISNIAVLSAKRAKSYFADFDIYVWDNSTDTNCREKNKSDAIEMGLSYKSENKNCALSYVYNKIINSENFDYIIISDDDTSYGDDYFRELVTIIPMGYLVSIPQIYINDSLKSPGKMGVVVGKHFATIEPGLYKDLIAITSGLLLSRNISSLQYNVFDENLDLYGIDTDFFMALNKIKIPVYVMSSRLEHNMSVYTQEEKLTKKDKVNNFRYINSKKATIYINRKRSLVHGVLATIYYFLYELLK